MTTLNLSVAESDGDAHQEGDDSNFTSVDASCKVSSAVDATNRFNSGFWYEAVAIPAGSTIDACTCEIYAWHSFLSNLSCDLYFEDVDDAADFGTTADVNGRSRTTATVSWVHNLGTVGYSESPEAKTLLQEVIDRGGWAEDNNLCWIAIATDDATRNFWGRSYDGDSGSNVGLLNIDFTPPSTGQPTMARTKGVPHVHGGGMRIGRGW